MMNYRLSLLALILAPFGSPILLASSDPHPPVNPKTIIGEWESGSTRSTRIFRLSVASDSPSYLAIAYGGDQTMIFCLSNTIWNESGVVLQFQGLRGSKEYTILITLTGVASELQGVLSGTLIMNPDQLPLNEWEVTFYKGEELYFQQLARFSRDAEAAIGAEQGAAANP